MGGTVKTEAVSVTRELKALGVSVVDDYHKALHHVVMELYTANDSFKASNAVLKSFGIAAVQDRSRAVLAATAIIEYALMHRGYYIAREAARYANETHRAFNENFPILVAIGDKPPKQDPFAIRQAKDEAVKEQAQPANDKKIRAKQLFAKFSKKLEGKQLIDKIADEMGITAANARYYVAMFSKQTG